MSRRSLPRLAVRAALAAAVLLPSLAGAQSLGDRLKKRAKEAAERTVEQRVDNKSAEATDAALDKAESTVKCAASDRRCIDSAKKAGKKVVTTDAAAEEEAAPATSAPAGKRAAGRANVGKDFTPGTRVLFATDFKRDEIGDFPRSFELGGGNFEVAEIGGTRYLRGNSFGEFEVKLPETLPEMFTMEFDLKGVGGWDQEISFVGKDVDQDHHSLAFGIDHAGIEGPGSYRVRAGFNGKGDELQPVQVMADGKYVKVYVNGVRVANAPNANLGRSRTIRFIVHASEDREFLLGNLRIAAGGKDLYKALSSEGRVTAEGIFFDTNSDRIRAESEPALAEIGAMLKAHPELRLSIEGHTDNVGVAARNQTLSEQRAAAVRTWLTTNQGIPAAQLESRGFGPSRPAAPNDSDENRQKNRRVELVKL